MNEYLTTFLAEDHRQELLAEARADALAREALAGRPSWWRRRFAPSANTPTEEGRDVGEQPHGRDPDDFSMTPGLTLPDLSEAQHRNMVLSFETTRPIPRWARRI